MKKLITLFVVSFSLTACQPSKQEQITTLMDSFNTVHNRYYHLKLDANSQNGGLSESIIPVVPTPPDSSIKLTEELKLKEKARQDILNKCMEILDDIIVLDSMHLWANGARSRVFYEMGNFEQALKTNQDLEKKFGDTIPDIYYSRSKILEKMGRYEGATFNYYHGDKVLLDNIKKNPNDSNLMLMFIAIGYEFDGEAEMNRRVARMKLDHPEYSDYFCKMLFVGCD